MVPRLSSSAELSPLQASTMLSLIVELTILQSVILQSESQSGPYLFPFPFFLFPFFFLFSTQNIHFAVTCASSPLGLG